MKVLITGSEGQLGKALQKFYSSKKEKIFLTDLNDMDITNYDNIKSVVNDIKPDVIINCAAFTDVEMCEIEKEKAYSINSDGPENLARICFENKIKLVHLSTDYVFDGEKETAYTEVDKTNPTSVYGKSKLLGEMKASEILKELFIVRTAWMFGDGKNFISKIVNIAQNNDEINVVCDQFGTPTSADEVAKVIDLLIHTDKYGIYHATCEGVCNWAIFARKILECLDINRKVIEVSSNNYNAKAVRPKNSVLNNKKLKEVFNYSMSHWEVALKKYIQEDFKIKKKVLVTGANGYLGRHVVQALLDLGYDVYASDFRFDGVNPKAKFITESIFSGKEDIYDILGCPDVCIHLAWKNGFVHNDDSHIMDLSSHYIFIKNMVKGGLKNISVMGTMHEVGFWEGAIDDKTPTNPISLYGIAKNALRQMSFSLTQGSETNLNWLRAYYIMGDDLKSNSIFSKIVKAEEERKEYFPFTSGKNKYDFISVEDLAYQIAVAGTQTNVNGIINVCTGKPVSLAEKVEQFIQNNGFKIKLQYGAFPDRPYDSDAVWGDATKINLILENVRSKQSED